MHHTVLSDALRLTIVGAMQGFRNEFQVGERVVV